MAWAAGNILQDGNYIIEKVLGVGAFGITYLAKDKKGNLVVLKSLNDKVQRMRNFPKLQQDFVNEALCLAKCSHPRIVRIDKLIQQEALWCMVMEYIDGLDLATRIENEGAIPESEALVYIHQIGDAVNLVHHRGFLHRDIKPLNIMLRAGKSEAVLIDFGLAREFTPNMTDFHTRYLTDGFAPIEQYDKRAIRGAYTDVYGLAATLYALLTAEVPETASARDRSVVKHQTDPLVPPKQLNPLISDRVNSAILDGMALEPENRPQTVPDWLRLLGSRIAPTLPSPEAELVSTPSSTPQTPRSWSSAVGMDYSNLQDLLAEGKWLEGDRETAAVMLKVYGREEEGRLSVEDITKFPCRDLRTIDQLWVTHSNGRFGFSVQSRIWDSCGKDYEHFGDAVGWRSRSSWLSYSDLTFNSTAPLGHLPSWGRRGRLWSSLANRLVECSL